ncbi:MAG: hypothetical protein ACYCUV_07705 [Phycisphaerae bacterium]
MTTAIDQRMKSFAVSLLESGGGLIEWPEHLKSGFAILPPQTAALLECPENTEITAESVERGLTINLASMFLQRAERLFPRDTSAMALKIDTLYLKKSAMDEPVARAFAFPNARVKVLGASADRVEYQFWHFAAAIESDEKWEDVVGVTINSRSHARLEMPDPLNNYDAHPTRLDQVPVDFAAATAQAAAVAGAKASGFIRRLEERMDRDMKRLKGYYHALLDDASDRTRRTVAEPDKTDARTKAVELELDRKTEELRERYTLRPMLRPVALVRLDAPALAVTLNAQRRDGEKQFNIYWNAMTKTLEPLACSACGEGIFSIHFAEGFVPLCGACAHK